MAKKDGKVKPGSYAELAELAPGEQVIPVKVRRAPDSTAFDDDQVTVVEMDILQIGRLIKALAALGTAVTPTASFVALAAEHPAETCAAIGVAIRWPAERVGTLGGASFMRVAFAVWEANHDFFGQLLGLLVSGSLATMAAPVNGAGTTPSGISSAGAIPPQSPTH